MMGLFRINIISVILFFALCYSANCQQFTMDTLRVEKKFLRYDFYLGDQLLTKRDAIEYLKNDRVAYLLFRRGRHYNFISGVAGVSAIGGIGSQVYMVVTTSTFYPIILGAGIIDYVSSILYKSNSYKNMINAVRVSNYHKRKEYEYINDYGADQLKIQVQELNLEEPVLEPVLETVPRYSSIEEQELDSLASTLNLESKVYLTLAEVQIGDYVYFESPFGERIYGAVVNKANRNSIELATYPSARNRQIQKVALDKIRKIETK